MTRKKRLSSQTRQILYSRLSLLDLTPSLDFTPRRIHIYKRTYTYICSPSPGRETTTKTSRVNNKHFIIPIGDLEKGTKKNPDHFFLLIIEFFNCETSSFVLHISRALSLAGGPHGALFAPYFQTSLSKSQRSSSSSFFLDAFLERG